MKKFLVAAILVFVAGGLASCANNNAPDRRPTYLTAPDSGWNG